MKKFFKNSKGVLSRPRNAIAANLIPSLPTSRPIPANPNLSSKNVPAIISNPLSILPFISSTSFILPSASAFNKSTTFKDNHPPVSMRKKFINLPNPNCIFDLTFLTGAIKAA